MGCAVAVVLALLAFMFSLTAMYGVIVEARDGQRWRAFRDHPASRGRPLAPEDDEGWGDP